MTRLRCAWAAASSSLRMAWVGALVLGVGVVAVGVWRLTDDPVDSVVDAESLREITSETALEAVAVWARETDEPLGDQVEVIWQGQTETDAGELADTVVLRAETRTVGVRRDGDDGRWTVYDAGAARSRSVQGAGIGIGYVLPQYRSPRMTLWCPPGKDLPGATPVGEGSVGTLPVESGFISPEADGCVGQDDQSTVPSTVWFTGMTEPPMVVSEADSGMWVVLTTRDDAADVHAAGITAIEHLRAPVRREGEVLDRSRLTPLDTGRAPQDTDAETLTVVSAEIDPFEPYPTVAVAASFADETSRTSVVLTELYGNQAPTRLTARWIGAADGYDGRPFLLYAASDDLDSLRLRVGTEDLILENRVGHVLLPGSVGPGRSSVPFALTALDTDRQPHVATEPLPRPRRRRHGTLGVASAGGRRRSSSRAWW